MPTTSNAELSIHYETFGAADDPVLLLINGLGSQLINYEPAFCRLFVEQGFQVVVFDNRDVGLTDKTAGPTPNVAEMMAAVRAGQEVPPVPYRLTDMADDGFAVLDAVGAQTAHIAGMSMGGMIVQRMAIKHPERILSMTSIMSTTGDPTVGRSTPEAIKSLLTPPPADREGYIEHSVAARAVTAGVHYSEVYWRQHAAKTYDRMFHPQGSAFQMVAVTADGDRTEDLQRLSVPSLVIHGQMDPLITPSGGEATAAAIPDAELLLLDDMGHDLPQQIWPQVSSAMIALAQRVQSAG